MPARRLRGEPRLGRRDLGRPPRPLLLPRQLPLRLHRRAGRDPAGAQLDALAESRARRDHRGDPRQSTSTTSRRSIELGKDFVRLHLKEMPNIPVMSYNVFSAMLEKYWTGYPTFENPYTDPVNNWANSQVHLHPDHTQSALTVQEAPDPKTTASGSSSMRGYLWFAVKRAIQMFVVIIAGTSVAFLITHLSPINPVDSVLGSDHSPIELQPRGDRADAVGAHRSLRCRQAAARAVRQLHA